MNRQLSGVRADQKLSYRKIEACAIRTREYLKLSPMEALDPLGLFENLDAISIRLRDGRIIPFRGGVEALEDSEGYARYDGSRNVLEILAVEVERIDKWRTQRSTRQLEPLSAWQHTASVASR